MANLWQYGLLFDNADEFISWLKNVVVTHKITATHMHHTYIPNHSHFKFNYKQMQDGMKGSHLRRGFNDIAQHITIFPDGKIMTGRNINSQPASAKGYNGSALAHPFMFELVGNFDKGNDELKGLQLDSAIKICQFNKSHFGAGVMFHREGLINGKQPKSCPGTGIDKNWFMGLVNAEPVKEDVKVIESKPIVKSEEVVLVLKRGDKGVNVESLQKKLNKVGFKLVVDGDFGPATDKAVRDFQKANKLIVDGLVGPNTFKKLDDVIADKAKNAKKATAPNKPIVPYPGIIKLNAKGKDVERIQRAAGLSGKSVDGIFGKQTESKVKEYQKRHGLVADGIVGPATWNKMF